MTGSENAIDPRIAAALNGSSTRVATLYELERLVADDLLAGRLVERSGNTFTVAAAPGSTIGGEPVEVGSWWRFAQVHRAAVVRRWLEQTDPKLGSFVAIRYRGRGRNFNARTAGQLLFDCGCLPAGDGAPAETDNPWTA